MRQNKFGESYCHTAAEARRVIDNTDNGWEVYASSFSPPEGEFGATCEIRENGSGDVICYLEGKTPEIVRAMAQDLKIEIQD